MKQIIKLTLPTGKVFITTSSEDEASIYNRADFIADLRMLPNEEQLDFIIRRQVLWQATSCDDETLQKKSREFIKLYRAGEPEHGYNILSDALKSENSSLSWQIGVDGCKAGWFYVASKGSEVKYGIVASIAALLDVFDEIAEIVIDIPIGLYDSGAQARACDTLARSLLKPRGSTVFPAPVRPCLYAKSHSEACDISQRLTGKRLSQQAFNIFGKIREVDELLQQRPELKHKVHEAHPELGFCMLNSGRPLLSQKKDEIGIEERLQLLEGYFDGARDIYNNALSQHLRKVLAKDDIVDAMMCLCIAQSPAHNRKTVPNSLVSDTHLIEMAMHYREP